MEPVNNSVESLSLVPHNQPPSSENTNKSIFNAASVQRYFPQRSAALAVPEQTPAPLTEAATSLANRLLASATPATNISNREPGPQYDRKEAASGTVWDLNKIAPLTALSSSEKATDSKPPIPCLELLLPESDEKNLWLDYLKHQPEKGDNNALSRAFGAEGAQYLKFQLAQLNTSNERVEQWKKVCRTLSSEKRCSFPFRSEDYDAEQGKGENIILELYLFQDIGFAANSNEKNKKADALRMGMSDFLKEAGLKGDVAYKQWPILPSQDEFNGANKYMGLMEFFMTTTQVRQLFTALRSFVTDQMVDGLSLDRQ